MRRAASSWVVRRGPQPQLPWRGHALRCFLHGVCLTRASAQMPQQTAAAHPLGVPRHTLHPFSCPLVTVNGACLLLTPPAPPGAALWRVSVSLSCFWSIRKCTVLPRVQDCCPAICVSAHPSQCQPQRPLPSWVSASSIAWEDTVLSLKSPCEASVSPVWANCTFCAFTLSSALRPSRATLGAELGL